MLAHRPDAGFRLGHRRWLDGLRGVAILLVVAFHLHLLPGGFIGVDVFFVLSGFLITSLLAQEWHQHGKIQLRRFYLRRVLRLLPAFALTLVIFFVGTALRYPERLRQFAGSVPFAVLYLMNWPLLHQLEAPWLGYTWSLSVEEQFYLIWPALLLLLLRAGVRRRWVLLGVVGGAVGCALLRAWLFVRLPSPLDPGYAQQSERIYMGLDTRGDALLIGCAVGLLAAWNLLPRGRRARSWLRWAALAGLACLATCALSRETALPAYFLGLFSAVSLSCAAVLLCMLAAPLNDVRRVLECTPLVWTGRLSYGLYLLHIPVAHFLLPGGLGWQHPRRTLAVFAASYAAALLSYFLVERPFLRLKDRCRATPQAPPTPANPARARAA